MSAPELNPREWIAWAIHVQQTGIVPEEYAGLTPLQCAVMMDARGVFLTRKQQAMPTYLLETANRAVVTSQPEIGIAARSPAQVRSHFVITSFSTSPVRVWKVCVTVVEEDTRAIINRQPTRRTDGNTRPMPSPGIVEELGLKRIGDQWRGDCPACGYGSNAFALAVNRDGSLHGWCASCGDRD